MRIAISAMPRALAASSSSSIASFQLYSSSRRFELSSLVRLPIHNHSLLASTSPIRLKALHATNGTPSESSLLHPIQKFRATISSLPPIVLSATKSIPPTAAVVFSTSAALLVLSARFLIAKNSHHRPRSGTVADLVRRGQLKSDSRGISSPLKYDDPFNNPYVKTSSSNSTVEVCGKKYKLAPVTLTREEQAVHQRRRSRAYQWKRPTVFLKEGDPIPPDVNPETVRWIPANHPFATTANEIDENLAQTNVFQKDGVPFRIRAEHEALQRKLDAIQNEKPPPTPTPTPEESER